MTVPLSAADPAERAELLVHHRRAADLLVQRRLPDDQVNLRPALAEDRLLAGQDRLGRPVPRGVVVQGRVGLGQCPRVGGGLQQRGDPLGLVGRRSSTAAVSRIR